MKLTEDCLLPDQNAKIATSLAIFIAEMAGVEEGMARVPVNEIINMSTRTFMRRLKAESPELASLVKLKLKTV